MGGEIVAPEPAHRLARLERGAGVMGPRDDLPCGDTPWTHPPCCEHAHQAACRGPRSLCRIGFALFRQTRLQQALAQMFGVRRPTIMKRLQERPRRQRGFPQKRFVRMGGSGRAVSELR